MSRHTHPKGTRTSGGIGGALLAVAALLLFASPALARGPLASSANAETAASVAGFFGAGNVAPSLARAGEQVAYRRIAPPKTPGRLGVDVGIVGTRLIDDGRDAGTAGGMRLHGRLGLSENIDVGLYVAESDTGQGAAAGGELSWAVVQQAGPVPAVLLTGHYARSVGVQDRDLGVMGVQLTAGYGLFGLHVYGGLGAMGIREIDVDGTAVSERAWLGHGVVGARYVLGPVNLAVQGDLGATNLLSLRLGVGI